MKKTIWMGASVIGLIAFVHWQGQAPLEEEIIPTQSNTSEHSTFTSKEQIAEKIQRLELLLKAVQLPTILPFEAKNTSFSVVSYPDETRASYRYTGDQEQEILLEISTKNSTVSKTDYEEVQVEKEGLYYTVSSVNFSSEELKKMLLSLEETAIESKIEWEHLMYPTLFPTEVLALQEVRYTKEKEETLVIEYIMKEEYSVAYTLSPTRENQDLTHWKKVKTDSGKLVYYSQEENQLLWNEEGTTYEVTSYGRELTLEEFLLMIN